MSEQPDLEALLAPYSAAVQELARRTCTLILDVLPNAVQTLDGPDLGFGTGPGYKGRVFVVTPLRDAVRLGVAGGAALPDPAGLMRGTGKVHRHIRITDPAELDRPELRELLDSARDAHMAR